MQTGRQKQTKDQLQYLLTKAQTSGPLLIWNILPSCLEFQSTTYFSLGFVFVVETGSPAAETGLKVAGQLRMTLN